MVLFFSILPVVAVLPLYRLVPLWMLSRVEECIVQVWRTRIYYEEEPMFYWLLRKNRKRHLKTLSFSLLFLFFLFSFFFFFSCPAEWLHRCTLDGLTSAGNRGKIPSSSTSFPPLFTGWHPIRPATEVVLVPQIIPRHPTPPHPPSTHPRMLYGTSCSGDVFKSRRW